MCHYNSGTCQRFVPAAERCGYSSGAVKKCGGHFSGGFGPEDWMLDPLCDALCAVRQCIEPSFLAAGPMPKNEGCCELKSGEDIGGAFSIDTFGQKEYIGKLSEDVSRIRMLGVNNRVVAGILLHTTRADVESCGTTRFSHLGPSCTSETNLDVAPYGVDPIFLRTSEIFDEKMRPAAAGNISSFTTSCTPPACGTFYSNDELNDRGTPFGFFHEPLDGNPNGFSIFFDINKNEEQTNRMLTYIKDGFFIDDATRDLKVSTVTYNSGLGLFSYFTIMFEFNAGGSILIDSQIQTISVENYRGNFVDNFRAACEVFFVVVTAYALSVEFYEMYDFMKTTGSVKGYFRDVWNYIDFASIVISVLSIILWVNLNFNMANSFTVAERYTVYQNLEAPARALYLADGGAGLRTVATKFSEVSAMSDTYVAYTTMFGINMVLMLFIFLKVVDFQPRLGVVTHTLAVAFQDLAHFFVILSVVFLVYAALGHVILGGQMEVFSSWASTLEGLFNFLAIGDQGDTGAVFQLSGMLMYPGILYYVSFTVIMVMILLNFLLGIIVDAFVEVKESFQSQKSVPEEVADLIGSSLGAMTGKHPSDAAMAKRLTNIAAGAMNDFKVENPLLGNIDLESLYRIHATDFDPTLHSYTTDDEKSLIKDVNDEPGIIKLGPEKVIEEPEMARIFNELRLDNRIETTTPSKKQNGTWWWASRSHNKVPPADFVDEDADLGSHAERGVAPQIPKNAQRSAQLAESIFERFGEEEEADDNASGQRFQKRHEDLVTMLTVANQQNALMMKALEDLGKKMEDKMEALSQRVDAVVAKKTNA